MKWIGRRNDSSEDAPNENDKNPFDLNTPLFNFTDTDIFTIDDATKGVQVFGATGSGKSSGSGKALAYAFLEHGFGGLVLTAKTDERENWVDYCDKTGRSESLIIMSPYEPHPVEDPPRFNFLDYALAKGYETEELVDLFLAITKAGSTQSSSQTSGSESQEYWDNTNKQLLRNTIDLLAITQDSISVLDMNRVILSAPTSPDLFIPAPTDEELERRELTPEEIHAMKWRQQSLCWQCIADGDELSENGELSDQALADYEITRSYWTIEFPNLAERTRSIIVSTFTSLADVFLRGMLRELFCTTTNIAPELTHEGVILLVDIPYHRFGKVALYAQVLLKYLWQQSVERRSVSKNTRPVFLWVDESQFFLTSRDQLFLTTARSSRACTVFLSQNISNYFVALGSTQGRDMANSMLGNLNTKIFHANTGETNQWAAELIGRTLQTRTSIGANISGGTPSQNIHMSEVFEYLVQPNEFMTLKTGGDQNNKEVESIIIQGGKIWNQSGEVYLKTKFKQS